MTLSRSGQDQERLIAYVREALGMLDAGKTVDPIELTAEDPHLARPLAEVLGLAANLPELQEEALLGDPLAGLVIAGRYRLDSCQGRGAMGVVYRAEDQELQRTVAVKILDARLFRDPQAEQRFQREAEALAKLQHAHVVTVHDRGRTPEGIHFLVMELLVGGTLSRLLQLIGEGADPLAAAAEVQGRAADEQYWPRLCARLMLGVAHGLAAAHASGLVHRDVKPSNVFVRTDGRAVLLDFGIAARASSERLTATETTLGTPWYMAPEQVHAGAFVTAEPTLDVYGLGATLYHLLAGRPPYEGEAAAVLVALQTRDPDPLLGVRSDVPRDLVAIVEHCLERDPQRRYPTAAAVATDLEAFLSHRPVSVRPLGAMARRLRAWRRAPAKPVAVAAIVLALMVAAVATPIYRAEQQRARSEQKNALHATLPSVLAVEGWPDERVLAELRGEHTTAIDLLDRILVLDPSDLPVRLFRAALRFDIGDQPGAAKDLRAIAEQGNSAYLAALAERYLLAEAGPLGAAGLDTDGLPAPVTPQECFVAGFQELRARHRDQFADRADALLERAAADYLPARDLRLLSLAALCEQRVGDEQRRLIDLLYDEAIKLEVLYDRETARTQAMRGVALLLGKRYADCVPCFLRSLELRPERHGPHNNLGIAYLRAGSLEKSEHHLREALRLRPFAWNTKYTFAQLEQVRGNFAGAYAWAEQVQKHGNSGQDWKQPTLIGNIAIDEAIALSVPDAGDPSAAAAKAVAAYAEALLIRPKSKVLERLRQIALSLQGRDLSSALVAYARFLLDDDPDGASQLRNLAFLMPEQLGPAQSAWVAAVLRRLAAKRAGDNAVLRARIEADLELRLRPYR